MLHPKFGFYVTLLLTLAGTAAGAQDQSRPISGIPRIVITRDEIQRQNIHKLDQLFDGQIPGIIAVDRGTSLETVIASRGVSSMNVGSTPRIYLNEVPLLNAAMLSQIAVESVDSLVAEVGAAAGTLVGSGATGGIVRIYTKRGRVNSPMAITAKSVVSMDNSLYNEGNKLFQDHALELDGGMRSFTYYMGGGYGNEGEWAPSYKDKVSHASAALSGYSRYGTVVLHGSFSDRNSAEPDSRLGGVVRARNRDHDLTHYVYGVTASSNFTKWWTNELFYGLAKGDEENRQTAPTLTTASDTTLSHIFSNAKRTSISYHTSVSLPRYGAIAPRISASYDKSKLANELELASQPSVNAPATTTSISRSRAEWEGFAGKLSLLVGNSLVVNAGARKDIRDGGIVEKVQNPKLRPRYDAAYTIGGGRKQTKTLTLRAAYGETPNALTTNNSAIPQTNTAFIADYGQYNTRLANPDLAPEVLRGTEAGFDYELGASRFSLTLFDQEGHGGHTLVLFDSVRSLSPNPTRASSTYRDAGGYGYAYQFQYIGGVSVKNRGLSTSIRTMAGPWLLAAHYTAYRSEIDKLDSRVTGVESGEVINDFPSQNGHATISYTDNMGTLSLDARYVGSHRRSDVVALSDVTYRGFATYDINLAKPMSGLGTLLIFVHNVSNAERYGFSNGDYVHGRRIGLGLRYTR